MAIRVSLLRYTDQGIRNVKERPSRPDAAKKAFQAAAGELKQSYLATGKYDIVIATPRPRGRLRICVIDDNEDAADSLHDLLELQGHDVHVAMDGQLGIDLVLAVHPDVVLCDVGLPGLDGFEVARRLRAAGSTAMLVALTGYASSEDVQRAQDAGFDHHLAKPTDLDKLDAVLAGVAVPEAASASAAVH
jgi:CheY-like chemotaxis protein